MTGYPSKDKPWLKYYAKEMLEKPIPRCTVYKNIFDNNKDYLDGVALEYFGNKITYRYVFKMVRDCAKSLRSVGIGKGDCVALCAAGTPEVIYVVLACNRIGALTDFINPLFTPEQMRDRINETGAKWMFVNDKLYPKVHEAIADSCIKNIITIPMAKSMPLFVKTIAEFRDGKGKQFNYHQNKNYKDWDDFLALGGRYEGEIDYKYEPGTPAIMVYSSGTTGASKGIVLTNDGINATIANYQRPNFEYERGERFLSVVVPWFSTGIVLMMLMPLCRGITVILEPRYSGETFAKALKKYHPTMTLASNSNWLYVAHSEKMKKVDLSGLRYPISGGEKISRKDEKALLQFLQEHGLTTGLIKGYGMCELGSTVSTTSAKAKGKLGGTGYPILNVTVSAFDVDTCEELSYNKHGEIWVDSPARMKEYYKNPNATKEFFYTDKNGTIWGRTGDIGYVDEDGDVFVLGRASDSAILENGHRVYLFDIEDVILEEETVAGCKVVDVRKDGHTLLIAHLILHDEVQESREEIIKRIHKHCIENLDQDSVPNAYKWQIVFPIHANGKRDVEKMKEDLEGWVYP